MVDKAQGVRSGSPQRRNKAVADSYSGGAAKELSQLLETSLENILGQNYVDEYSGSDKHIGVDEISSQLAQALEDYIEQREAEARRQAIKSYKKVNKFHEAEIRINELKWARDMAEKDITGHPLVSVNYINERLKALERTRNATND